MFCITTLRSSSAGRKAAVSIEGTARLSANGLAPPGAHVR
jgi:hypothetical protein